MTRADWALSSLPPASETRAGPPRPPASVYQLPLPEEKRRLESGMCERPIVCEGQERERSGVPAWARQL